MTYVVFALVALVAAALVVWPLLGRRAPLGRRDALVVYRDQLAELDRDLARGLIDAGAATAARREIERRILAEDEAQRRAGKGVAAPRHVAIAAVVALVVAGAGIAVYAVLGSPGRPDMPLAGRTDLDVPAMAEDEAAEIAAMVARLEERLAADPGDAEGWLLLANTHAFVGRFGEAAQAMSEALALDPANAAWHAAYGEFVALGHDGAVTPAARRAFAAALAIDPAEPVALYYLAAAKAQAGDLEGALAGWQALLAASPADAPWREAVIARIVETEQQLGLPPSDLAAAMPEASQETGEETAQPGPTEEDIAAAAAMTDDEQMEMIRGMVAGLAARLEDAPDDLEGWARLAQSYGVLGEWQESRAAYEHALGLAPEDPALLDGYAEAIVNGLSREAPVPAADAALLEDVLARRPDNAAALFATGLAAAQSGERDRALERWTRLAALYPEGSSERQQVDDLIAGLQ